EPGTRFGREGPRASLFAAAIRSKLMPVLDFSEVRIWLPRPPIPLRSTFDLSSSLSVRTEFVTPCRVGSSSGKHMGAHRPTGSRRREAEDGQEGQYHGGSRPCGCFGLGDDGHSDGLS